MDIWIPFRALFWFSFILLCVLLLLSSCAHVCVVDGIEWRDSIYGVLLKRLYRYSGIVIRSRSKYSSSSERKLLSEFSSVFLMMIVMDVVVASSDV